jgi:hypothetical protein
VAHTMGRRGLGRGGDGRNPTAVPRNGGLLLG